MLLNRDKRQQKIAERFTDGSDLVYACQAFIARPLKQTPTFGHTQCTHSIALLLSHSDSILLPSCSSTLLPELCPIAQLLPRHLGKVIEHTHTHTHTNAHIARPSFPLDPKFPQPLINRQYGRKNVDALRARLCEPDHRPRAQIRHSLYKYVPLRGKVVFFFPLNR